MYTYDEARKKVKERPRVLSIPDGFRTKQIHIAISHVFREGDPLLRFVITTLNYIVAVLYYPPNTPPRDRMVMGTFFLFYDTDLKLWVADHRGQVYYGAGQNVWDVTAWSLTPPVVEQGEKNA